MEIGIFTERVTEIVDITRITDDELLTLAHKVTVMLNERGLI